MKEFTISEKVNGELAAQGMFFKTKKGIVYDIVTVRSDSKGRPIYDPVGYGRYQDSPYMHSQVVTDLSDEQRSEAMDEQAARHTANTKTLWKALDADRKIKQKFLEEN